MEVLKALILKHLKKAVIVIALGGGVVLTVSVIEGETTVDVGIEE